MYLIRYKISISETLKLRETQTFSTQRHTIHVEPTISSHCVLTNKCQQHEYQNISRTANMFNCFVVNFRHDFEGKNVLCLSWVFVLTNIVVLMSHVPNTKHGFFKFRSSCKGSPKNDPLVLSISANFTKTSKKWSDKISWSCRGTVSRPVLAGISVK